MVETVYTTASIAVVRKQFSTSSYVPACAQPHLMRPTPDLLPPPRALSPPPITPSPAPILSAKTRQMQRLEVTALLPARDGTARLEIHLPEPAIQFTRQKVQLCSDLAVSGEQNTLVLPTAAQGKGCYSRRPKLLALVVMIVSPSRPHPVVTAVLSNVSVLYDVASVPMLRYRLVLADWMVPSMWNVSEVDTGPRTTSEPGSRGAHQSYSAPLGGGRSVVIRHGGKWGQQKGAAELFLGYACRYRWKTGSESDRICCAFPASATAATDAGRASAASATAAVAACILRGGGGGGFGEGRSTCELTHSSGHRGSIQRGKRMSFPIFSAEED